MRRVRAVVYGVGRMGSIATRLMLEKGVDNDAATVHGVTITGTGHQDVYWMNIVSLMMGTAHRIDSVIGRASRHVDDYGPEVARDQRVGSTVEEFKLFLDGADRPPTFGRNTLDALVADTGLSVASVELNTRAEIAEKDMYCQALGLTVPAGRMIGFTDIDTIRTLEGPTFTFEMTGCVYGESRADINDWEILGEPNLRLSNPAVPTQMTTCTQLVNRIPDVINAAPGFVTVDLLPQLRYRAFPLAQYLD